MKDSKLIKSKKENSSKINYETLYKGACVKIKNSQKTFQVIGINPDTKICWIRDWPFASEAKKPFALDMSLITLQIFCSNQFSE